MKESVLDVLMYLFETFADAVLDPEPDRDVLRGELARAGFDDPHIDRAFEWLDELNESALGAGHRTVGITIEHYIISSGIKALIDGSRLWPFVKAIFGCEFATDEHGRINFPKKYCRKHGNRPRASTPPWVMGVAT